LNDLDIPLLSVEELDRLRRTGEECVLLDVREPFEREIARIPGSVPIPLGRLPELWPQLDRSRRTVIHCHYDVRSREACRFLRWVGFEQVQVLEGGIDAWAERIDPTLARY